MWPIHDLVLQLGVVVATLADRTAWPAAARDDEAPGIPSLSVLPDTMARVALLQQFDELVAPLRDADYVEGVVVFGSHARREIHSASDIDLLIVYRPILPVRTIKKDVRKRLTFVSGNASTIFFTIEDLLNELDRRPSFAAHLADEGIFLYCLKSCAKIRTLLSGYVPDADDLARELRHEIRALNLFKDLSRFNGQFVSTLARLYSIARSVLIIRLLQNEIHEYSWWKIFDRYAALHPELGPALGQLASLRPYYEYLIGRREMLPAQLRSTKVADAATVRASIEAIRSVASQ